MLGQVDAILGSYESAMKRLSEATVDYRKSIRRQPLMMALLTHAYVLLKVDQREPAEAILREVLERLTPGYLMPQLVIGFQVECITHYGYLYGLVGRGERAISYLSWASARLVELNDMPLVERFAREYVEALRTSIAPAAFEATWAYGKTLASETIVTELLANPIFSESASVGSGQGRLTNSGNIH
jgi:tetratricopeptide (TPR) repeat protein